MSYEYLYDEQKNLQLKAQRGVGFEDVITAINNDKVLDIIPHHNKKEYPHQKILIVEISHYIYLVPYVTEENVVCLKTVFPSRKFTKRYLKGGKHDYDDKSET